LTIERLLDPRTRISKSHIKRVTHQRAIRCTTNSLRATAVAFIARLKNCF